MTLSSKLIRKSPTRQNDGLWNNLAKIPHMNLKSYMSNTHMKLRNIVQLKKLCMEKLSVM